MVKIPGRPIESNNIQVIPLFRNSPDIEKLGRALISLADYLKDKSQKTESANNQTR